MKRGFSQASVITLACASDGKRYKEVKNQDYENNWFMMTLHHDGNRWLIDNVHSLAIEKK